MTVLAWVATDAGLTPGCRRCLEWLFTPAAQPVPGLDPAVAQARLEAATEARHAARPSGRPELAPVATVAMASIDT